MDADAPKFDAKQVTHYNADEGLPIASLRLTPTAKPLSSRGTEANGLGEMPTHQQRPEARATGLDCEG
jgi:hypothetical protein